MAAWCMALPPGEAGYGKGAMVSRSEAVGGEVADPPEAAVELGRRVEVRHVDQVVDLTGPLGPLVDGGDLHRQHEADRPPARRRQASVDRPLQIRPQPEQSWLGRDQV